MTSFHLEVKHLNFKEQEIFTAIKVKNSVDCSGKGTKRGVALRKIDEFANIKPC